jgi:sugar/nucleoside kinase (ribokinase family)
MKRAAVAGHICLDIIPAIDHHVDLTPGRLYEVGPPTIATGGAVSNTGVALHLLGIPTRLLGKIGTDSFGDSVLAVLKRHGEGLERGMVAVEGVTTSYTVVVNIPGSDRIFLHCPGANETYVSDDVHEAALSDAALFHFGYPAFMAATYADNGEELLRMYRKVKDQGLTTSLDLGMPDANGPGGRADWEAILKRCLPYVDCFMPSADELLYALDRSRFGEGDDLSATDLSPLAERLLDMGVAVAAIKMGARGMYVRTADAARLRQMGRARPDRVSDWAERELWFPIFQEERFVGATGAGDTTIAGFLASMLRGNTLEQSGRIANAVGACNVEAADALGGIRSWEETMARMEAGWMLGEFSLDDAGWSPDAHGIWHGPADRNG